MALSCRSLSCRESLKAQTLAGLPDAPVPPSPVVGQVTNITSRHDIGHQNFIGGGRDVEVTIGGGDPHIWYPQLTQVKDLVLEKSNSIGARW